MHPDPFEPVQLGDLSLKNAFIKAATNEGMCEDSKPTNRLIEFHRNIALGGTAMTTVSYGAVSPDGKTFAQQLCLSPESLRILARLTKSVHEAGGKASIQLTHCGFFTNDTSKRQAFAPSRIFNAYGALTHLRFSRALDQEGMRRIKRDFVSAMLGIIDAGFDAAEVHMGHGYLLSQFLSPVTNKRKDDYGGDIIGRSRYPLEVFAAMRAASPKFPLIVKLNMHDGLGNGITPDECIYVASRLQELGCTAIELTGGFTSKSPFFLLRGDVPLKGMIRNSPTSLERVTMRLFGRQIIRSYPFTTNFFLPYALHVREYVKIPLIYLGGVTSRADIDEAMSHGFNLIGLGRALIHDPAFINKLQRGEVERSGCTHCNECIVEMYRGGVRCVLND